MLRAVLTLLLQLGAVSLQCCHLLAESLVAPAGLVKVLQQSQDDCRGQNSGRMA